MNGPVLRLEHLSKTIERMVVLSDICLTVEQGRFVGVVGLNGSGKTVLSDILTGRRQQDSGTILLGGEAVSIATPLQARLHGIYSIRQDVTLAENLTVAENLCFDDAKNGFGLVSPRRWVRRAQQLLDSLQIPVDASKPIRALGYGERRMVELARLYSKHPKIAILDDCLISLPPELMRLAEQILQRLLAEGIAVLCFSHRLEPWFPQDGTVVFICDSKIVRTAAGTSGGHAAFASLLDAERVQYPTLPHTPGRTVLSLHHISTASGLRDVSFSLRKGEILGIAGTADSGKHALAQVIFGLEPPSEGTIQVGGAAYTAASPRRSIQRHIGYLPEDTQRQALIGAMSVEQNICMSQLLAPGLLCGCGRASFTHTASDYMERLRIDCQSPQQPVSQLSWGNQQKVNVAKWLQANCSILIMEEPFKGIAPAALLDLYNYVCQFVLGGASILLISSNYAELAGLCDAVLVMKEGHIAKRLPRGADATARSILEALS